MTRALPLNIIAVLLLGALPACPSSDCASKPTADERDWCYHAASVEHAKRDELQPALEALNQIQAPMVRTFAVQQLMVAAPKGMTKEQAESLCRSLGGSEADICMRTWSRPHLWEK